MGIRDEVKDFPGDIDWYQSFIDLLPGGMGIYEVEKNGITSVYASDGIFDLLTGYSEEEIKEISKHIEKLIYEKDMALLQKERQRAIEEKKMLDINVRYRKSPDRLGWLWIRGKVVKTGENRTIFMALLLEVSQLKKLETNLLIQQQRYHILEETSSDILFELKPDEDEMTYTLKEWDGTFSRKVVKKYMESLQERPMVHPDSIDEFKRRLQIAMMKPTSGEIEYLSSISGRGYEWHCCTYTSIADDSGHVESIFGRIRNIHDEVLKRKKKQKEKEIDMATNLYHNHFLVSKIKEQMKASALDCGHTLILVGINHFSEIVKKNGHSGGDVAMTCVSRLFGEIFQDMQVFGRKGNDKFMVYISDGDDEKIDDNIKEFLALLTLPENKFADINISCSVGVASVVGHISYDELYEKAEEALYRAKITKGKDYIRIS